ncbi:MAG: hypothetical protein IJD04_03930 [Desulfovibrionaceae bacterium]|nr:hypothetical protein [Desulfovibrionaceae bacterium]
MSFEIWTSGQLNSGVKSGLVVAVISLQTTSEAELQGNQFDMIWLLNELYIYHKLKQI